MVLNPSTAECASDFSAMNLIKSDVRNLLSQDSVRMLLTIKQHGPSFDSFCPDRAITPKPKPNPVTNKLNYY